VLPQDKALPVKKGHPRQERMKIARQALPGMVKSDRRVPADHLFFKTAYRRES
jgi:hypothetical protein